MHTQIKWVKWFALAFVAGLLLPRSYGPLLSANSLDGIYDDYTNLDEVIKAYHLNSNAIVNYYLERLLDPNQAEYGYVSYPPDLPNEDGAPIPNCSENNVSTFCLAVALNENLEDFGKYLQKHQNDVDFGTAEDGDASTLVTLNDALKMASSQRNTVDAQVQLSEETLDLTLAIYNQVQLVYPLHAEMLTLIENLDDYRSNLAELRNLIERYPSKFNGASTAQCK